jgi:hypothetical protein
VKTLATQESFTYLKMENSTDVNEFKIEGFEFFKKLGIIDYKMTFKAWLRKFPRPIVIMAVKNHKVVAWVYIDEWAEGTAHDGYPVYVLRAIETQSELRQSKIGYRLVLLGLREIVGYLITKPITPRALKFFKGIGFKERDSFRNCPIELRKFPNYLILPTYTKKELIEKIDQYFKILNDKKN